MSAAGAETSAAEVAEMATAGGGVSELTGDGVAAWGDSVVPSVMSSVIDFLAYLPMVTLRMTVAWSMSVVRTVTRTCQAPGIGIRTLLAV